jgi:hypothetical protein
MLNLPIGFIRELSKGRGKIFKWNDPDTRVEVIYSDEISGDGINGIPYIEPDKISIEEEGMPILTLKKLIEYKLSSGTYGNARYKDFDHILGLIKSNNLPLNYVNNLKDQKLISKYKELWGESRGEVSD